MYKTLIHIPTGQFAIVDTIITNSPNIYLTSVPKLVSHTATLESIINYYSTEDNYELVTKLSKEYELITINLIMDKTLIKEWESNWSKL